MTNCKQIAIKNTFIIPLMHGVNMKIAINLHFISIIIIITVYRSSYKVFFIQGYSKCLSGF